MPRIRLRHYIGLGGVVTAVNDVSSILERRLTIPQEPVAPDAEKEKPPPAIGECLGVARAAPIVVASIQGADRNELMKKSLYPTVVV
jgi:hypothetical protein